MIWGLAVLIAGAVTLVVAILLGRRHNQQIAMIQLFVIGASMTVQARMQDYTPTAWFIAIDAMALLLVWLIARHTPRLWEVIIGTLFLCSIIGHIGYWAVQSDNHFVYISALNVLTYLRCATLFWGIRHDRRVYGPLEHTARSSPIFWSVRTGSDDNGKSVARTDKK